MGRKIIKKELDKSKLKLKQEDISRSVNQLQFSKQKLKDDNSKLLDDISKQEKEQADSKAKTVEFIKLKEEAERNYIKAQTKLSDLEMKIANIGINQKDELNKIKELGKQYKDRESQLSLSYELEDKKLKNKIKDLKDEFTSLVSKKEDLIKNNEELKNNNEQLEKDVLEKSKFIKEQKDAQERLISNINKFEDEYITNKLKKDVIKGDILKIEERKTILSKEIKKLENEKNKILLDISEAKKDLFKTREATIKLVKREEDFNVRSKKLQLAYKKVGFRINDL